jgi:archaetidylinositol phosphate synthase
MANGAHTRVHTSLAGGRREAGARLDGAPPAGLDQLRSPDRVGRLAMLGVGICFWLGTPATLIAAVVLLAVNWFGDSLDGTLARVRHHERPRYGFYVDHVLDVVGILLLFGGLVLGGFMSPLMGAAFLLAYYLLMVEIALATHAVGTSRMSYWKFGPTELRILLAMGTLQLLRSPHVTILGESYLLFDVGGGVAIVGLLASFVDGRREAHRLLYAAEPLPGRRP